MKVRIIAAAVIAVIAIAAFAGCTDPVNPTGTKTAEAGGFDSLDFASLNIDPDAVVNSLNGKLTFDDKALFPLDDEIASSLYKISGMCEDVAAVGSTGATAECIVFAKCADESGAKAAVSNLKGYAADMSKVYAGYNAAEADKLTKAFIMQNGKYVIMIVSPDSAAAESAYKDCIVSLAK